MMCRESKSELELFKTAMFALDKGRCRPATSTLARIGGLGDGLLRLVPAARLGRQPREPGHQPLQRVAQRDDPRVALLLERVEVEREAGVREPQAPRRREAGDQGG